MNWQKIKPPQKHILTGFLFLVVIAMVALIICFFSDIANYFFGEAQKFNGEFFKVLVTILGGLLVLWDLYLNYKRTKILEVQTNNQADQIKAFVKQNEIAEKGKVDERFKNAIEHLGSEIDAIVLGGIYALHRIAQEDKTYRQTVFDILCSFIREKTSILKLWSDYAEDERAAIKPTIVIQTIIDLLFKSNENQEYIYNGQHANLIGIRCINANFNKAHLDGVDLSDTHLEGSTLNKASLKQAKLHGTHLDYAILVNSHMEDASLIGVFLNDAKLLEAHLEGANLRETHLEGAILSLAYLEGTNLRNTHLEGANLKNAHLESVISFKINSLGFIDYLENRIGKNSEYSNVHIGKLNEETANKIIDNFSLNMKDNDSINDLKNRLRKAQNRETNIEKDAILGILTKERAEGIIERYNKAMENIPKR